MKKYSIIASLIALIGVICASSINSYWWLNQPKTPSMLSK